MGKKEELKFFIERAFQLKKFEICHTFALASSLKNKCYKILYISLAFIVFDKRSKIE